MRLQQRAEHKQRARPGQRQAAEHRLLLGSQSGFLCCRFKSGASCRLSKPSRLWLVLLADLVPHGVVSSLLIRIWRCGTQGAGVFKKGRVQGTRAWVRPPKWGTQAAERCGSRKRRGVPGGDGQRGTGLTKPQDSSLPLPSYVTLAGFLPSLCLGFLTCKMRIIIRFLQKLVVRIK